MNIAHAETTVIQFGGPSGNGYMSQRQLHEGHERMLALGRFEDGAFRRNQPAPDGRVNQDAYEAVWEHENGRPIAYSKPRFAEPVHFREKNFDSLPVRDNPGAQLRQLGSFTERDVSITTLRLRTGAEYLLEARDQERIAFVREGQGSLASGEKWWRHSALQMKMFKALVALAAMLWLMPLAGNAQGAYPSRPVKLIIASSPGGGTDALGRVMADALGQLLKQSFVPENRAGASGVVGSEQLLRAPADGYTVMITQNGHTTNPAIMKKLPYDTVRDFSPIAPIASSPLVLIATTGSGVKTVKELVELGKRDPKAMTFASAESSTRLAAEMLSEGTGLKFANLMYKGTGPAVTDVAGGHVNFAVTTMASVLPFRNTGKVNFIAVLGPERSAFLPEVPTMGEQGYPGIVVRGWWGVFGPAGMPPAVVEQLNAAIRTALGNPEVQRKMATLSAEPWLGTPGELDAFVRREIGAVQALAKRAGIEPE